MFAAVTSYKGTTVIAIYCNVVHLQLSRCT